MTLLALKGSCHNNYRTEEYRKANTKSSRGKMSLLSQKTSDTEELAEKYFGTRPLTETQKELLNYIQQLEAEDSRSDSNDGGRICPGEPSVDPSRHIRPNQGDSEWIEEW